MIKKFVIILIFIILGLGSFYQCRSSQPSYSSNDSLNTQKGDISMKAYSPDFKTEGFIPINYTCQSEDISPEIIIENIPENTKSIALICDDPDAPVGTWVHWVIINIKVDSSKVIIPRNIPKTQEVLNGAKQGINDFKRIGYGGPCPPPGSPHRYFFKIYALDTFLNLDGEFTKADVERAMQGHIIAQYKFYGLYQRK